MKWMICLAVGGLAFLSGCQDDVDRLKARTAIESRESADREIEAQKAFLDAQAQEMEKDLARRHRFYQAVSGTFEGKAFAPESGISRDWRVRILISPTLEPYRTDRIRRPEEVAFDLNNLALSVHLLMWTGTKSPEGDFSETATGCIFVGIRPSLESGAIHLKGPDCTFSTSIYLSEEGEFNADEQPAVIRDQSTQISAQVLDGGMDLVHALRGVRQASGRSIPFRFAVTRQP